MCKIWIYIKILNCQPKIQTMTMSNTRSTNKQHNSFKLQHANSNEHHNSQVLNLMQTMTNAFQKTSFPVWSTGDTDWDSHNWDSHKSYGEVLDHSMMENWAKCMYDGKAKKMCRPKIRNLNWCWVSAVKWRWSEQLLYHKSTNLSSVIFTTNESCWSSPPTWLLLLAKSTEAKCISARGIEKGGWKLEWVVDVGNLQAGMHLHRMLKFECSSIWMVSSLEWPTMSSLSVSPFLSTTVVVSHVQVCVCKKGCPPKKCGRWCSQYEGSS